MCFGIFFLFKFIFLEYECTFISANHTIYNIGYLEQTGKNAVILMKSNIFTNFLKKMQANGISWKKIIKNIFNRWRMLMHIILATFTLNVTE